MHTEIDLQLAIKSALERDIIPEISLWKPGRMKVYLQDIPITHEDAEAARAGLLPFTAHTEHEHDIYDKYLPCFIVKLRGAEEKTAGAPQVTTVEIVVVVKDWSEDMSGYQSLMVCIQRVRDYFLANAGIRNKFRMSYPVKWVVNEEAAVPYFIGSITTKWDLEVMPYNDTINYL